MSTTGTRIGQRWRPLRSARYLDAWGADAGTTDHWAAARLAEKAEAARQAARWEAQQARQWAGEGTDATPTTA